MIQNRKRRRQRQVHQLHPNPNVPPLDTNPQTENRSEFNISRSPRNKRVKSWARNLLSPGAQEVHVPSWYTKYMTAITDTPQGMPHLLDSSPNITQQPAPVPTSRYNLRRRQNTNTLPLVAARQVQPQPNKNRRKRKHKNKQKSNHDNNNNTNGSNGDNNNNDNDNNNVLILNTEDSAKTGAIFMDPPRKRIKRFIGSITGSQSAVDSTSGGPSTVRPNPSLQINDDQISITTLRDRQTERLSAIQKLMSLERQRPPFEHGRSIPEDCPTPVIELCHRLQSAAFLHSDKIIPGSLRDQILEDYPTEYLPDSVWAPGDYNSREMEFTTLYERVKGLYNTMIKCNGIGAGVEEVSWYGAIEHALSCFRSYRRPKATGEDNDRCPNYGNLTAILCTTSEVINECLPHYPGTGVPTQSARVDLLIGYDSTEQPLKSFRAERADCPLPFTPLKKIERAFLGAIPIEVKNATGNSMDARYQLALCSSAMLRLRQQWASSQKKQYNADKPPVVVSLSVIGHVWSYYITYLGKPRRMAGSRAANAQTTQDYHNHNLVPRILLGPFIAGHTTGLLPTFHLFRFFGVLRDWLAEEWGPEIFEELAGIPMFLYCTSSTSTSASNHV